MRIKQLLTAYLLLLTFLLVVVPEASALEFESEPTRIIIPSLKLSLPVSRAPIVYDTWDVRLDTVSYGESSALPGNKGNTVLFAHALPEFFESLPKVKKGDYIHLFANNDWFTYKTVDTVVVNPEDVRILEPFRPYDLTVYTCIGDFYEKRFILKARLVSVDPTHSGRPIGLTR